MPRRANPKREREYEHLKGSFKKEGRYKGREEEVAARIVNKQRRQYGETEKAKQQEKDKTNPDRHLPINRYRHLGVEELTSKLDQLSPGELRQIEQYEKQHKNRKTLLNEIKRKL